MFIGLSQKENAGVFKVLIYAVVTIYAVEHFSKLYPLYISLLAIYWLFAGILFIRKNKEKVSTLSKQDRRRFIVRTLFLGPFAEYKQK